MDNNNTHAGEEEEMEPPSTPENRRSDPRDILTINPLIQYTSTVSSNNVVCSTRTLARRQQSASLTQSPRHMDRSFEELLFLNRNQHPRLHLDTNSITCISNLKYLDSLGTIEASFLQTSSPQEHNRAQLIESTDSDEDVNNDNPTPDEQFFGRPSAPVLVPSLPQEQSSPQLIGDMHSHEDANNNNSVSDVGIFSTLGACVHQPSLQREHSPMRVIEGTDSDEDVKYSNPMSSEGRPNPKKPHSDKVVFTDQA